MLQRKKMITLLFCSSCVRHAPDPIFAIAHSWPLAQAQSLHLWSHHHLGRVPSLLYMNDSWPLSSLFFSTPVIFSFPTILRTVTPWASSSPNIYVQISGVSLSYPRPQLAYSVTTTAPPRNCSATNSFTFSQSTSPRLSTVPSLPKDQHLSNLHASVLTTTLHLPIILAWTNSVPALSAPGPAYRASRSGWKWWLRVTSLSKDINLPCDPTNFLWLTRSPTFYRAYSTLFLLSSNFQPIIPPNFWPLSRWPHLLLLKENRCHQTETPLKPLAILMNPFLSTCILAPLSHGWSRGEAFSILEPLTLLSFHLLSNLTLLFLPRCSCVFDYFL